MKRDDEVVFIGHPGIHSVTTGSVYQIQEVGSTGENIRLYGFVGLYKACWFKPAGKTVPQGDEWAPAACVAWETQRPPEPTLYWYVIPQSTTDHTDTPVRLTYWCLRSDTRSSICYAVWKDGKYHNHHLHGLTRYRFAWQIMRARNQALIEFLQAHQGLSSRNELHPEAWPAMQGRDMKLLQAGVADGF